MTADTRPAGIVCPLATPLRPDGHLNEPVLRSLIDALVPDLDGLFVLGSSGELTWLPDDVADRVARVAVEQVAGRIPVYVGVGDTGLRRTLDRAARLGETEPDYLVVASPFYYEVGSEDALVDHFTVIADAAAAPLVLYNIPQNTHLALSPSAVATLAQHPKIVGMKDSAGDWFAFERFLGLRGEAFSVLQGREQLAAASLWAGADGVISGLANLAPRLLQSLAAAISEDRPREDSLALQASISELAGVFEQGYWLAGLKCALATIGWDVSDPSRPIQAYDADQRAAVERIVRTPALRRWLTEAGATAAAGADG